MGFHAEALPKALDSVIEQMSGVRSNGTGNLRERGIEVIAVTNKPGLSGSLSYVCENIFHCKNFNFIIINLNEKVIF